MIHWNTRAVAKTVVFVVTAVLSLGLASGALADLLSTFELDGNPTTQNLNPGLPDDWDRVLILGTGHQALSTGLLVDPSDSTRFTQGSKDILDISTGWHWDDANSPDKDEITNAYAGLYSGGKLFFGCDRFATNGTSYIGFWLLQGSIAKNPDGTFSGNHIVGDILILSDFTQGGGVTTIRAFRWVGSGGSDGSLDSIPANPAIAFAIVNSADQPSPWAYTPKTGTSGIFPTGAFFEGGADLGALGITGCFTSFLCETRSSASVTAELKDFVLGNFPSAPVVSVQDAAICVGNSAQLCANVTGGVAPFTYLWNTAATTSCITVSNPGTYIVRVTGSNGCASSDTATLTVNQPPVLVCSGDELTCDSTLASARVTSTPNVGVSYVWSPAPVTGQGTNHARYNAPGTKKVVVTILATGCKDSCEAIITQNITKPVLVCSGDELTCDSLLASAKVTSTPSGGVTYVWSPAPVTGQGTNHARYDAPGTKKIVVTILATGCKDSCNAVITQNVTKPVLACSGDTLTCDSLLASATVTSTPSGGVTYVWSPAPVIGQGTANVRYDAPGTKKVVVTILATGCKDSCNAVIAQDIVKPTCELTAPATLPDCGSTGNELTATTGGAVSYLWSVSGAGWAITAGGTTNSIVYTAGDAGSEGHFKIILTAANGCKDSCEVTFGCTPRQEFCTYTMGGWGSGCPDAQKNDMMSTQPGCIRDHYFTQVYPQGFVVIGDPDGPDGDDFYAAKFTSAAAIEAALPSGATGRVMTADSTNPVTKGFGGVLGGQILALRLNRDYSCAGIFTTLGMPGVCFSSYVIPDSCGKFAGITVDRFLAIADSAVGGKIQALVPFGARLADVVFTATCLNEGFEGCEAEEDGSSIIEKPQELSGEAAGELSAVPKKFVVNQSYPNPFNPMTTINYGLPVDGKVTIEIYDIVGRKIVTLLDATETAGYHSVIWYGKDSAGTVVASGVYFCRVQFADKADVKKLLMLK